MSEIEKNHLWGSLAALSMQADDLDLARAYCRRVAEREPKNILIRHFLCDLNLRAFEKDQAPDLPELDRQLSEIEQLSGRGPYWLYGKAIRTLVQSKKKDPQLLLEARGYLKEAMDIRKEWSAPAVLAGKICELQDEPDQALDFYVRAIYRMGERDGDVIRRTVQLLVPRGHIEEAKQLFDYLEKQKSPLLSEMKEQYVTVEVFTGRHRQSRGGRREIGRRRQHELQGLPASGTDVRLSGPAFEIQGGACQAGRQIRPGNDRDGAAGRGRATGSPQIESPGR